MTKAKWSKDIICLNLCGKRDGGEDFHWELVINNRYKAGLDRNKLIRIFDEIGEKDINSVIWVNRMKWFEDYCKDYFAAAERDYIKIIKNNVYFVDFGIFSHEKHDVRRLINKFKLDLEEDVPEVVIMHDYVEQELKKTTSMKYLMKSYASRINSRFYNEFPAEKDNNIRGKFINLARQNLPPFKTVMSLFTCNLGGELDCPEATYFENVYSFDIRSAYAGMFMRKKFPIKLNKPQYHPTHEWIEEKIKQGKAVLIQFEEKEKGKNLSCTDVDYCSGRYIKLHPKACWWGEYDYLDTDFRMKLLEAYNNKQKYKNVDNDLYQLNKDLLQMIYGKGIQYFFSDDATEEQMEKEYDRKQSSRMPQYIQPQYSVWASAYTREEIRTMMLRCGGDAFAWDTDSIKTTTDCRQIFNARNQEIIQELADAGITNTDIGTWAYEGFFTRLYQQTRKVYVYECDGKMEYTIAGCRRDAVQEYYENKSNDEVFRELKTNGVIIPKEYGPILKPRLIPADGNTIIKLIPYEYRPGVEDNV